MCEMFDKVAELSRLLTEWSVSSKIKLALGRRISGVTRYTGMVEPENTAEDEHQQTFLICTGGGPGFMEAANMGAAMVPGSKNIGVSLFIFFTYFYLLDYILTYYDFIIFLDGYFITI